MPPELRIAKHKRQTPSHTRSRFQEKEKTERLGARLVPRSGAGDEKGDVRLKGVLRLECKATKNQSFSVTREMVQKIENAALGSGELAAIHIEFLDLAGKVMSECCVVPAYVLDMIRSGR